MPEESMKEQAKEYIQNLPEVQGIVDDLLEKYVLENPEAAKEYVTRRFEASRDFVQENTQAMVEKLKQGLNLQEKFSMLYKVMLSEIFGKNFISILTKGVEVSRTTMAEAVEKIKDEKLASIVKNNNVIWPSAKGLFGGIKKFLGLSQLHLSKEEDVDVLNVITGSTIVMPRDPDLNLSRLTQLRHAFAAMDPPVKIKNVSSREAVTKPAEDEVFFVYAPKNGLPKKGGAVDKKTMEGFKKIFDQGDVQWFQPALAAGAMVMDGISVSEALSSAGITSGYPGFSKLKTDLAELGGKEVEVEESSESGLPKLADGSIDKAKLEEYRKKQEKGAASWLKKEELAAVYVLQGAPVEQAMESAGVQKGASNYSALKRDLESLV